MDQRVWSMLVIVTLFVVAETSLVKYRPDYRYEYTFKATTTTQEIGVFETTAKVGFIFSS